ncbi:MAG TPA: PTS sugar transporter subunit IIA [Xanthobacteraceae bacterium]|nr:PTS sugar transporter subunit IIA [Xanthobacteraceae bacterium]
MIGIVLVTHGRLAVEFRAALEHVVGQEQKQIETVMLGPDDDVERCRRDIIEAVKRVDSGDGVVILTDMFGGTPSNLSISLMNRPNVEVLAGINLPMLVKLAKVRADTPLAEAVARAQEAGRKYITVASRVLAGT